MTNLVKCGACGWVHFELALEAAQSHTDDVNAALSRDFKPVSVERYFACGRCGASSVTFVPAELGDAPPLATLRGIVLPLHREQQKCDMCIFEHYQAPDGRIVRKLTCTRCGASRAEEDLLSNKEPNK